MSEHIQPSADPHPAAVAAALPERTPGVSYEKSGFDFWLILRLGFGLIVTVVVLQLAVSVAARPLRDPRRAAAFGRVVPGTGR